MTKPDLIIVGPGSASELVRAAIQDVGKEDIIIVNDPEELKKMFSSDSTKAFPIKANPILPAIEVKNIGLFQSGQDKRRERRKSERRRK